jgi:isoquinoline 1-oxidoreductase alpha subunit
VTSITINGKSVETDADPNTPLLWVLRDHLGLTGTKFGCGVGQCGACTVQIDGVAVRSCLRTLSSVQGEVRTIEGLSPDVSHPLQAAWIELNVPQCGYCQAGMLMAADALLRRTSQPTDADIDAAMTNICRCGTYPRIRAGIMKAVSRSAKVST